MRKVALIRGKYLNQYELQTYYPLIKKYEFTGFGAKTSIHDSFPFPVRKCTSPIDILSLTDRINLPSRYTLGILNRVFTDGQKMVGLVNELKGYDIAHVADTHYGFTYQAIQAKKKKYVKKVVATIFETIPFNNYKIRGRKKAITEVLQNLDHALAVTKKAKETLIYEGYSERKISVIPLGIDTKRFYPQKVKKEKKEISILFVGRLEWNKGIYDVLNAFTEIKKEMTQGLRLQIVGDGSQKKELKNLITENKLDNYVQIKKSEYENMPSVYREADIFIAPSKKDTYWEEQFSVSLLEAQASGLPIITTNSGAINENVGDAAIIEKEGDPRGLTQALKKLIENPKLRYTLGRKARLRSETYFDVHKVADKIDKVYKEVLA